MKNRIVQLLIVVFALAACERDTEEQGPSLNDIYGEFAMVESFEASRETVDFQSGESVNFTAQFSKRVNWEVHIIGKSSGATKILSGLSDRIDGTSAKWNGTTTQLPMFKEGEECMAVLAVENENFSDTIPTLTVTQTRPVDGYVVADFDEGLNAGADRFVQSGAEMRFDTVFTPMSPQGSAYWEFSGTVDFVDDLGNIMIPKSAFIDSSFTLITNSDAVYINFFARKGPGSVNDIIVFQFMEDDDDSGAFEENPGSDDLYQYVIQGLTNNWQLYSVKYSELEGDDPSGNGLKNPEKFTGVRILPIGLRESFEAYIDYIIMTENQPLVP